MKEADGEDILIFGSPLLSETLMESKLIDEFWVFIHPAFFGHGLLLFSHLLSKTALALLKTDVLPNGENCRALCESVKGVFRQYINSIFIIPDKTR